MRIRKTTMDPHGVHDSLHKLLPPAAGFLGSVIMMTYLGQMPPRLWVVALLFGTLAPYLAVPTITSYLHLTFTWLPKDGGIEGLVGFLIGLGALFLVGALATIGQRFERNPTDFRTPK